MDLADVPERTLSVCEKKGDILPLMFIRMLFFLLVSFVEQVTYRSEFIHHIGRRSESYSCLHCFHHRVHRGHRGESVL